MRRNLVLVRLQIEEAVRSKWLPVLCAFVLIVLLVVVVSVRGSDKLSSFLSELALELGVFVGFVMAWTHAGSWYERGLRSGSLVFATLQPLPRRNTLLSGWTGNLAVTASPLACAALSLSLIGPFADVTLTELWMDAAGVIAALAFWVAAFVVGPLFLSRGTTGGILLVSYFLANLAPMIARSLGGEAGRLVLYVVPPLSPVLLLSNRTGDVAGPIAEIVFQGLGTVLLLIVGVRRFESMDLLERT